MFLPHFLLIPLLLTHVTLVSYVDAQSKIDKDLEEKLRKGYKLNVMVSFGPTSPTLRSLQFNRTERKQKIAKQIREQSPAKQIKEQSPAREIRDALKKLTEQEQQGVIKMLTKEGKIEITDYESLWISNSMYIRHIGIDLVNKIAKDSKVRKIFEIQNSSVNATNSTQQAASNKDTTKAQGEEKLSEDPQNAGANNRYSDNKNYTWGLQRIQVPEAWVELGGVQNAGAGVVVGIMDSGVYPEHISIRDNFVGQHGWFDPRNLSMETPNDFSGMGTHLTGTVVGKFGVGVAPAGKYSICRGCFKSVCYRIDVEKCIQFFICPTLPDGTEEDCSKVVDVMLMTLAQFPYSPSSWFEPIAEVLEAVGIFVVAAIGEGRGKCLSPGYPSSSEKLLAVSATTSEDMWWPSNAVGPARQPDGKKIIKPDISAPGERIKSAKEDPEEPYMWLDGSSSAAAHVAGVVALLKGKVKGLTFEKIRDLIRDNADTNVIPRGRTCGGYSDKNFPNPFFGWGRINAYKAVKALLNPKNDDIPTEN